MNDERGFTIIELLVTLSIFAMISTGFMMVMLSGTRSSQSTRSIAEVSQEARLGFNRMIRDTREADAFQSYSSTSYTVLIDFDQDGEYGSPNAQGDYEILTYAFDGAAGKVTLNGETLMEGVKALDERPVFAYASNHLEYDWDGNGITTLAELQDAHLHGSNLTSSEILGYLSSVEFALELEKGACADETNPTCHEGRFFGEAQLRNRR